MTAFALYARVSTTDQLDGMSIDAQLKTLHEWAHAHDHAAREFVDAGKSAWTEDLRKRPAFNDMLEAARAREITGIAVTHLDRFSRKVLVTLSVLGELGNLGVGFVSLENTAFDFTRPADRLMLTVLGAFAEYYSAELSRKIKRGLETRASKGLSIGLLEFGYCNGACLECKTKDPPCPRFGKTNGTIIAHPDDAPGIALAYETYRMRDKSFDNVADVLNAAGYRSRVAGKRVLFNKHSVDELLSNIGYTGIVLFKGREIPGKHPALISRELFDEVQAIRHSRKMNRALSTKKYVVYLLSGIMYCAGCNRPMRAQYRKNQSGAMRLYYRCMTNELNGVCALPSAWINEDDLLPQLAEIIAQFKLPENWLAVLNEMVVANGKPKQPNGESKAQLTDRLARLKKQFSWGDISERDYIAERDGIKAQLARAHSPEMASIVNAAEVLQSMANAWEMATQEERRDMLRAIFESVTFDPVQRRLISLNPKSAFRLLFRQMRGLRERGEMFEIVSD